MNCKRCHTRSPKQSGFCAPCVEFILEYWRPATKPYTAESDSDDGDSVQDDLVRRNSHGQRLCRGKGNTCETRARGVEEGLCIKCGGGNRCCYKCQ